MKHLSPFIATHKRSARKRGQSLVEFALILPLLLLFIMGTIDFGRALFTYAQASSQLRQALRLAAVIGYDSAPIKPYLDCDRMRETARSVYFANQPIPMQIMYLRAVSNGGSAWNPGTQTFTEPTSAPELCGSIGPTPPTSTALENGDILRIQETVSIAMITPLFPQKLTFILQGQRTVITHVTLASVQYCGDLACQPDRGENSTTCVQDCPAAPGNTVPSIVPNSVAPACAASITTPYTISVQAVDPDPGDEAGKLHVYAIINDGAPIPFPSPSPASTTYTLDWDPPTPGTYKIQIRVEDNTTPTPNRAETTPCNVTVTATGSSNTVPVIDEIAPSSASPGATTIRVYAHDNETAMNSLNVTWTAGDGMPLSGTATWNVSGYYDFAWEAPSTGPVTISVTVKDTGTPQMQTTSDKSINIIACGGDCPPGPVAITSPGGGDVSSTVPIVITAPDDGLPGQVAVYVKVDGSTLPGTATLTGPGYTYTYSWNTTSWPNGSHTIVAWAVDLSGTGQPSPDSTGVTVNVANGVNTPPVIDSITTNAGLSVKHDSLREIQVYAHDAVGETPVGGLNVTVTVSGGTLSDLSGVATWNGSAYVINWTVPASGPTVNITATVKDTGTPQMQVTNSVTATVLVPTTMHVGALTMDYTWNGSSDWVGLIIITVVDNLGDPVPGVMVTGNWMAGIPSKTGRDFCLAPTNTSGQCTIQVTGIQITKSLSFTMLANYGFSAGDITGGTLTYIAGDNVVNTITWGPPTVIK